MIGSPCRVVAIQYLNFVQVGHNTGQSIMLKDTQSEREQIVRDFANRKININHNSLQGDGRGTWSIISYIGGGGGSLEALIYK